jgi:hypothetical protein
MAVYIIQDILEDENHYIASRAALEDAQKLVGELEEFDMEEDSFLPNRYKIRERGYCYNDYSEKCGHCMTGICMLQNPDIDCPLVRKRAAAMAAGEYANQPTLMPGA